MSKWLVLAGFVAICLTFSSFVFASSQPSLSERDARLEEVRSYIEEHGYSWVADHTPISDLPEEEFQRLLGLRLPENYEDILKEIQSKPPAYPLLDLPSRFDWTDSGAVSPVRRQWCGDCWAQCSVAAMESKLLIFDDDPTRLSVQQAIDCNYGGSSCDGGWMEDTYDMYRAFGAVRQGCYRYTGSDGLCAEDTCEIIAKIDGWEYIDTSVTSIKTYLMTNGPIAVGMTVYNDFSYYTGGCYEHAGNDPVNHGVLIVGWDDSKCGGAGAWHIKNSWGTSWGESGYAWLKYGTCNIGAGAAIIHYTPRNPVNLVYESLVIDDSSGDGDGKADAGETIVLPVSITNKGRVTATGVTATIMTSEPGITVLTSSASYPDIDAGATEQSNSPHFSFSVDSSVLCGTRVHFILSIESDQGNCTDNFDLLIGDALTIFFDDVEVDTGWTLAAPDDDATSGRWKWKNPVGSFDDGILVQTEIDHTPGGAKRCYVTSNTNRSFDPGVADVDDGKTTLTSPLIDLSPYASARLRYWRWYTNDTGGTPDDVFLVDVSSDSGVTWVNLETEGSSARSWQPMEFDLGDYIALTDKVLVRFIASDYGEESIVEAAIDDVEITGCPSSVDTEAPTVQVVYPNGGEEITEGTQVEIKWRATDDYGFRHFIVAASYDGGATYSDTLAMAGALDSTYTWDVPMGSYEDCKIGVTGVDRGYNEGFDESDSSFTIVRDISGVTPGDTRDLPDEVTLVGSDINPFSQSVHIFYAVPRRMATEIKIYDVRGTCVREVLNSSVSAGYHSVVWDGRSSKGTRVSPGIYFVRLEAGGITRSAKILVVR